MVKLYPKGTDEVQETNIHLDFRKFDKIQSMSNGEIKNNDRDDLRKICKCFFLLRYN